MSKIKIIMQYILKKIIQHKVIAIIIIFALIGVGYFGYKKLNSGSGETRYVLAAVEKGTLITSISGSGQVSALNQLDIKSKVSGDFLDVKVKNGQEVKAGEILAQIDARDAQRAVNDAEIALESAKINLEDLLSPLSLLRAENDLKQAERDSEKAEKTYQTINEDTESVLAEAYENGHSDVSTSFFKLSDYIQDLKDVLGADQSEQKYIDGYKLMLGSNSLFISQFLDDYNKANYLFNKNFELFRTVSIKSDRDTVYKLISDTLETTKAISQALESARHMYDAITIGVEYYKRFDAASQVDKMQPKIETDLSSIFSTSNSLQETIDTIDNAVQDTPDKIKDAELAFNSAKENLEEKKQALEEIKKGVDSLNVRSQQNIVAQKEAAFSDAKDNLASCFVRAPFDGVIATVDAEKGDSLNSGTVIANIITKQQVVEISLNEVEIADVKVGQKVTFTFDAVSGLTITGEVAEINSVGTVNQGVVSYKVKIVFDTQDNKVKPGMSVSAMIVTDVKQNVLLVPNSAVKTTGGMSYVEISDESTINSNTANISGTILKNSPTQKTVEVGLSNDSYTEIISGLNEGDNIVVQTISSGSAQNSSQTSNSNRSGSSNQGFRMFGM